MRNLRSVFSFLVLLLLGGLLFFGFKKGNPENPIPLTIETGMTAHHVANQLLETGLIKSKIPFLLWVRLRKADLNIRIGRYKFNSGRSSYWIVDDLVSGQTEKVRVVVPEGFASWQIAERLETAGLCSREDFLAIVREKKLEGYLFPATYEFEFGLSSGDIVEKMKNEFDRRWTSEFDQQAAVYRWKQLDAVVFASIIEREIRVRDELPMISAVYHNRLKKRMRLEADPTVQYALGFWKERLSYDDYRLTKSPYNTYLNGGLPPGAICNPGLDAIRAALWPAPSEALFILAQEDGRHTFSTTYRDHTNKVNARNRANKQNMIKRKP